MDASPEATITDGTLVVRHLTTTDTVVVDAAARFRADRPADSLAAWVHDTLAVGARAVAAAGPAADLAAVRAEMASFRTKIARGAEWVHDRIGETVAAAADETDGTIARAVRGELGRLTGHLDQVLGSADSPVRAAVDEAVRAAADTMVAEVHRMTVAQSDSVRSMFDAANPAAPIQALHRQHTAALEGLDRRLSDLAAALAATAATTAERSRGPGKGAPFEASVVGVLADIARKTGDDVDHTGSHAGALGRSKKGDVVVSVDAGPGRARPAVVVEAKDEKRSASSWRAYLGEAARNRSAVAALAVVRHPSQTPTGGHVDVLDRTTVVVAWEPGDPADLLVAAYRLLRAQALAETAGPAGGQDLGAVLAAIDSARARLKAAAGLTAAGRRARGELDRLLEGLAALSAGLDEDLDSAARPLRPAPATPAEEAA